MRLETSKCLYDMRRAAALLREFTGGKTFADYQGDAMLRSAVERQFEIIEDYETWEYSARSGRSIAWDSRRYVLGTATTY